VRALCVSASSPKHTCTQPWGRALSALGCRSTVSSAQLVIAAEGLTESELVYPAWDRDLSSEAAVLARRHELTVNDALFPALAIQLGCELVTADRAHARVNECTVRLLL